MLLEEVQQYQNLELLARQVVEGFITGLHKSPFHGFSVEFAEHRPYNPGESTRNIDWKLFARTDRVYVKRYEEETNLRCRILLDLSGSMFYPENTLAKLRFSVLAAASLCNLLHRQRDAFGLLTFDSDIRMQTAMRSSGSHLHAVLKPLQELWDTRSMPQGLSDTRIEHALEYAAQTSSRRSLIVVFSDMFENSGNDEAIWRALQHLRFVKNEVILFHVMHAPEEQDLLFENRPIRFVDAESGEKLLLNPSEVRDVFRERSAEHEKQIRQRCLQYGIDFYQVDVSKDLHQVLQPFYLKRMKMT